jgi:hypothetical protein
MAFRYCIMSLDRKDIREQVLSSIGRPPEAASNAMAVRVLRMGLLARLVMYQQDVFVQRPCVTRILRVGTQLLAQGNNVGYWASKSVHGPSSLGF